MQRQGSFSEAGMCQQEKADAAAQVFGRDGAGFVPWARLVAQLQPFYPRVSVADRRSGWSGCRGFTFCSSVTDWPMKRLRTRYTTVSLRYQHLLDGRPR